MNNLNVLFDIKQQLNERGELLHAQRQFLIDAIGRLEDGEPLEQAFANAKLPSIKRGKQSPSYQQAEWTRNIRLRIAVTYMDGPSDWKKCEQLAALASRVRRLAKTGTYQPATEPEKILLRIIGSGTKLLITPRGIFKAVFRKN